MYEIYHFHLELQHGYWKSTFLHRQGSKQLHWHLLLLLVHMVLFLTYILSYHLDDPKGMLWVCSITCLPLSMNMPLSLLHPLFPLLIHLFVSVSLSPYCSDFTKPHCLISCVMSNPNWMFFWSIVGWLNMPLRWLQGTFDVMIVPSLLALACNLVWQGLYTYLSCS